MGGSRARILMWRHNSTGRSSNTSRNLLPSDTTLLDSRWSFLCLFLCTCGQYPFPFVHGASVDVPKWWSGINRARWRYSRASGRRTIQNERCRNDSIMLCMYVSSATCICVSSSAEVFVKDWEVCACSEAKSRGLAGWMGIRNRFVDCNIMIYLRLRPQTNHIFCDTHPRLIFGVFTS